MVKIDNIVMQDVFSTNITKGVVVEVFDHVDNLLLGGNKDQFIGSFLIKVNTANKINYKILLMELNNQI